MTDQEKYEYGRGSVPASSPTVPPASRPDRGSVASTAGETGFAEPSVADQAQEKAPELAGQAQDKAQQVAGQARAQLRDQVEQRSSQAAEQINQQASDLRTVSQSLREQGKDGPASAADRLAGYAERVGGYLKGKSAEELLHDVEDLGRQRPWAAAGAGAVVGLAASRFLKASARERYASRSAGSLRPAETMHGAGSQIDPWDAVAGGAPVGVPGGMPPLASPGASASGPTPGSRDV